MKEFFANIYKTTVKIYVMNTLNSFSIFLVVIITYLLSKKLYEFSHCHDCRCNLYSGKRTECLRKQTDSSWLSKQEIMELMMLTFFINVNTLMWNEFALEVSELC